MKKERENIYEVIEILMDIKKELQAIRSSLEYDTSDMKKCEYIEAMRKVYFEPPEQKEKCKGYRNKYTGQISLICAGCVWIDE